MNEQYILGINGWDIRSHDTSAALIKSSTSGIEIIAAAEEERFIRKKHAYDTLPYKAVEFCLEQGKISLEDISTVALSWNMPKLYRDRNLPFKFEKNYFLSKLFNKRLRKFPKLEFIDHHLCHALSAFSPSGFDSAAVLVVDGQGEYESTSLWKADGNNLEQIAVSGIDASLGYFYESLTEFVGFRSDQAGKTMGLAPYGNKQKFLEALDRFFLFEGPIIRINSDSDVVLGKPMKDYLPIDEQEQVREFWFQKFNEITGLSPNDSSRKYSFRTFPENYLDLAASGQEMLEKIIVRLARSIHQETGHNNLCLSGGVALNCVANGRIVNNIGLNIYVQPAANDAGTAIGAALEVARAGGYSITNIKMSPYLGKEYSNQEILETLRSSGIKFREREDMLSLIGELISKRKVLGLFQGRFEFGPRALGNRSFIADPRTVEVWDYINKEIKGREEGRPLAATILDSDTPIFFGKSVSGPHMTITYRLINDTLKAVKHVDSSTRPQILVYEDNPLFYQQIAKTGEEIGVNALINTSLNFQKPMINTPLEALDLFRKTKVDAIIFNNTFIAYRG
ncbi:MAG: hypothetical protein KKE93_04490 [Nanoarchaeota archaeon]|nr:hypothetical protein [Nanoarchaeota archaeon]